MQWMADQFGEYLAPLGPPVYNVKMAPVAGALVSLPAPATITSLAMMSTRLLMNSPGSAALHALWAVSHSSTPLCVTTARTGHICARARVPQLALRYGLPCKGRKPLK